MGSRGKRILSLLAKELNYTETNHIDEISVPSENHNLKITKNVNVSDPGKLNLFSLNEIQYITMQSLLESSFRI